MFILHWNVFGLFFGRRDHFTSRNTIKPLIYKGLWSVREQEKEKNIY